MTMTQATQSGEHAGANGALSVLLVEDNPADARLLRELLADVPAARFRWTQAGRLDETLRVLDGGTFDLILLDLSLPDSSGLATLSRTQHALPHCPIVVLTGLDDETVALQAVQGGAQDFLVKGYFDGRALAAAMRNAVERKRVQEQLRHANTALAEREQALLASCRELACTNEKLSQTQLQLLQVEKMESVGRLAAGVAHEVKNPLAVIAMGIDYLSRSALPDEENVRPVLAGMRRAVGRALGVIRGLLDFSAPATLDVASADVNEVIEQSLLLVKHELLRSHVVVHKAVGGALPRVRLDVNKIEQVFINLLTNAAHAMPDGGSLMIATRQDQAVSFGDSIGESKADRFRPGDVVVIVTLEDTGPGIPEEKLAKVFDPFYTTKSASKGTGLGLTVVRNIVELHRGAIEIRNRPEGGLAVTLTFRAIGD